MSERSYLVYSLYFKNLDVICILFKDDGLYTNKVGTGFRKLKEKILKRSSGTLNPQRPCNGAVDTATLLFTFAPVEPMT